MDTLHSITRRRLALSGALAVGFAFGLSELVAAVLRQPSPVRAIGDFVIDNVPPGVKDWAIDTFGIYDKLVLVIGIVAVGLLIGAAVGLTMRRGPGLATGAFVVFAVVGAVAANQDPLASPLGPWLVAMVGAGAGIAALRWLGREASIPDPGRRAFIARAGVVAGLGVLLAAGGRALATQLGRLIAGRDDVVLPDAGEVVAAPGADADFMVPNLTPIVVPNEDFYRIDTALVVPQLDLDEWQLSITGMVERPFTLTYQELVDLPLVERYVTLSCVSNPVGGNLVGNARWLGVPLTDLLDRARVQPEAEQLVGIAVDEFTVGFPVQAAYDGREAMVAVGMNGEPLPFEHGFPARLVVSGLYGYVSATKWLREINLTSWDGFDAYWVPRGWSKEGPIKTQSRIDTPRSSLAAGSHPIAGVAWAPNVGIDRVEIQVDEGPWLDAALSAPLSLDTWVQWKLDYPFTAGTHSIRVRATDSTGAVQPETPTPVAPDGATGWHRVTVSVG
ncbi:MAG TPA: molybdopterin-dependent oxidoreductase [Acidimicrobiia bacterium]|nr:molybdopterin-dependent oxidoreductase [Acidimicrobiia bacterium]